MKTYRVFTKYGTGAVVYVKASEYHFKGNDSKTTVNFFAEQGEEVAVFNMSEIIGFVENTHMGGA
jgi:hypothetical protein